MVIYSLYLGQCLKNNNINTVMKMLRLINYIKLFSRKCDID